MGRSILIVSPAWLGDIIMSQSLLKTLKKQEPDCHITVYAPAYAHVIIERMAEVDKIIENPFAHGTFNLKARYAEGQKLKAMGFDKAYILPNSLKSALPPFFAGIKERIGLKGESRYVLLNKMRKDKNAFKRMTARYVALAYVDDKSVTGDETLPAFDYPQLQLKAPSPELLERLNLTLDRPLLVLGCGANYGPAKLWPAEYFAKVSVHFIKRGWTVVAPGSPKDKPTTELIAKHIQDIATADATAAADSSADAAAATGALDYDYLAHYKEIAGMTSLTEVLDLIGASSAAVCNDSGLMHTVAAANVPQVCIFGSTSTGYTPPLSDIAECVESTQPCHPCFKRTCKFETYACLKELTPELVIEKLTNVINKRNAIPCATTTA